MIDALLPNMHGKNAGKISGKMDCSKKNEDSDNSTGFSTDGTECINFSELYAKISECNKSAIVEVDDREVSQVDDGQSEMDISDTVDPGLLLQLSDFTCDVASTDAETKAVASQLIKDALHTITEALGLPDRGIEKLNITDINESTINQFAEIIDSLNQIASVLDTLGNETVLADANTTNPGEIPGIDDMQQSADQDISSLLRVEQFKLQMGMQLLGISADVQSKVADMTQQVSMTGMNQAVNPSLISMPIEQMRKLFGKVLDSMGQEQSEQGTAGIKFGNSPADISVESVDGEQCVEKKFDTQTYRKLLNVDAGRSGEEKNSKESIDVNPGKKDDLMTIVNSEAAIADESKLNKMPEFSVASDIQHIKTDVSGPQSVTQEKITSALHRMNDETSVLDQITGKMSSVIRSGSNEVRIQLRPESLGEVSLRIKMEGDVVFTKIQVESQQVKQIVESNLQVLKDALAGQNLSAGLIDVSVGNNDNSGGTLEWDLQRDPDQQADAHHTSGHQSTNEQNDTVRPNRFHTGNDTGFRYGNNSIEYYA